MKMEEKAMSYIGEEILITQNQANAIMSDILDLNSERSALRDAYFNDISDTISLRETTDGYIADIEDLDLTFLHEENSLTAEVHVEEEIVYIDLNITMSFSVSESIDIMSMDIRDREENIVVKVNKTKEVLGLMPEETNWSFAA